MILGKMKLKWNQKINEIWKWNEIRNKIKHGIEMKLETKWNMKWDEISFLIKFSESKKDW